MLKKSVAIIISVIISITAMVSCASKEKVESEDTSYLTITLSDEQEKQVDVIYQILLNHKSNGEYGEYTYAGKQGEHSYFLAKYGDFLILEHRQSLEIEGGNKISSYAVQYSYYWVEADDFNEIQVKSEGNGYYEIGSYRDWELCQVVHNRTSIPTDQELTIEVVENTYKKMLAN